MRKSNIPKKWLVFCNRKMWHHAEALHEIGFINWTMHRTSFSIGDIVYLFMSDERRIRFMTKVTEDNCKREDNEYRIDRAVTDHLTYKLELVAESMNEELKEENLVLHGFNGGRSIQTPTYNNPELFDYITPFFLCKIIPGYDEIEDTKGFFEGALKKVYVNRYERDQDARKKCIEVHGCKCAVCGMDFEKMYGEIGRGFIHVHHIVPISSIGEECQIDPEKDLIPVCPNCHAMLHHGNDGQVLTIEELKNCIETSESRGSSDPFISL